jgi:hypothetical protein
LLLRKMLKRKVFLDGFLVEIILICSLLNIQVLDYIKLINKRKQLNKLRMYQVNLIHFYMNLRHKLWYVFQLEIVKLYKLFYLINNQKLKIGSKDQKFQLIFKLIKI